MADKYLLVPVNKPLPTNVAREEFSICSWESDAISEAKRLALVTGEGWMVYEMVHIGTSTRPYSDFNDNRPLAVPDTEGKS